MGKTSRTAKKGNSLILMREAKLSQKWQNEDARKGYVQMHMVVEFIHI
jgi:hypothetical protein